MEVAPVWHQPHCHQTAADHASIMPRTMPAADSADPVDFEF